jgi:hypothetical protein
VSSEIQTLYDDCDVNRAGLDTTFHSRYFAVKTYIQLMTAGMVHVLVTNLTPGSANPSQSKHIQLMKAGIVHVTNRVTTREWSDNPTTGTAWWISPSLFESWTWSRWSEPIARCASRRTLVGFTS